MMGELTAIVHLEPDPVPAKGLTFDCTALGGSAELRQRITATLPGVSPDNITVTVGAGEALAMVAEAACLPGAHVVIETPAPRSALMAAQK
ncbi:hypothetical protein ACFVTE_07020 [Arthrobacter sp. NPDC058097]|uniref:hypothetical protein n=1 Tax=Arthrobacter sp. NPDC058097 TaxID=3346340 RepID=UPI0036DA5BCB